MQLKLETLHQLQQVPLQIGIVHFVQPIDGFLAQLTVHIFIVQKLHRVLKMSRCRPDIDIFMRLDDIVHIAPVDRLHKCAQCLWAMPQRLTILPNHLLLKRLQRFQRRSQNNLVQTLFLFLAHRFKFIASCRRGQRNRMRMTAAHHTTGTKGVACRRHHSRIFWRNNIELMFIKRDQQLTLIAIQRFHITIHCCATVPKRIVVGRLGGIRSNIVGFQFRQTPHIEQVLSTAQFIIVANQRQSTPRQT
mmetsp:Transcript_52561/g.87041  ORF Transcript_52561/g.87041 Transcript_52561/m.87041 type:complete len:247 (+) Transcript_52561:1380-2120(+)